MRSGPSEISPSNRGLPKSPLEIQELIWAKDPIARCCFWGKKVNRWALIWSGEALLTACSEQDEELAEKLAEGVQAVDDYIETELSVEEVLDAMEAVIISRNRHSPLADHFLRLFDNSLGAPSPRWHMSEKVIVPTPVFFSDSIHCWSCWAPPKKVIIFIRCPSACLNCPWKRSDMEKRYGGAIQTAGLTGRTKSVGGNDMIRWTFDQFFASDKNQPT